MVRGALGEYLDSALLDDATALVPVPDARHDLTYFANPVRVYRLPP